MWQIIRLNRLAHQRQRHFWKLLCFSIDYILFVTLFHIIIMKIIGQHVCSSSKWFMKKNKWHCSDRLKLDAAAAAQLPCSPQFEKALQGQGLQVHPPRSGAHPPGIQMGKCRRLVGTIPTAHLLWISNKTMQKKKKVGSFQYSFIYPNGFLHIVKFAGCSHKWDVFTCWVWTQYSVILSPQSKCDLVISSKLNILILTGGKCSNRFFVFSHTSAHILITYQHIY